MSKITNLILHFSISEDKEERGREVNKYFYDKNIKPLRDVDSPGICYGGDKVFETNLYFGAFNYMDLRDFISHLETVKWEYPDEVQIIVMEQDDEGFRIVNLQENKI